MPVQTTTPKILEAAACLTLKMPEAQLTRDFGASTLNAAAKLGRISYTGLASRCLEMEVGEIGPGAHKADIIRAAASTQSLPTLVSNLANRACVSAYRATGGIADAISSKTNLKDFKPATRIRLTATGGFERLGPGGEVKQIGMEDSMNYQIQGATHGAIFGITREMEMDDDIGAIMQLPKLMGRQAAIAKEQAVFSLLLGGIGSFFSADNNNYLTGAGTALSASSLGTAAQALREQKDSSGDMLLQVPRAIVCPPALETTALTLYRNTTVYDGATLNDGSAPMDRGDEIPIGRYTPAVGGYMGVAGGISNGSDTGWILIGNPQDVAAVEIGYLDGEAMPVIRPAVQDPGILGLQFLATFDFGVALADPRAAVYSNGHA